MAEKKKHGVDDPTAPLWSLTYGDMMSLLLTFFILLFSMSSIDQRKFEEVLISLETYFGVGAGGSNANPVTPQELVKVLITLPPEAKDGVVIEEIEGYHVRVTTLRDGAKIVIGGRALFEPGSADLSDDAKAALREVARLIRGYRNRLRIVGHTDPTEEGQLDRKRFRDLYQLSYERADAVRKYLIELPVEEHEMRVHPATLVLEARAHFDPAASNMGAGMSQSGERREMTETGKLFNRRVEIVVTEDLVPWEMIR